MARGEAVAFDECVSQFGGIVWSLARRLSPSLADAEDAAQEIFLDLWRHAGRFDSSLASESTFITMIARRRLIDRHRKRSRELTVAHLEGDDDVSAVLSEDPVEIQDEAQWVRQLMGQLRVEERRVLDLSIHHGLTQHQIAEKTQMPLGTVKTHARRGLMKLRELMSETSFEHARGGPR